MFTAIDEIDAFSYEDCVIKEVKMQNGDLELLVEALIVEPKNSQNANFTKSYADLTKICFTKAEIKKGIKEGYKRYDADDNLLQEVADEPLSKEETDILLQGLSEHYLYDMKQVSDTDGQKEIVLGIEMKSEDPSGIDADSYQLLIACTSAVFTWERYLNRVQSF